MAVSVDKMLERTPEGFKALSTILYVGSGALAALTLGEVSGTLLLIGCIVVIVLASSREKDAAGTIYASHLANIRTTMMVNLVAALVLIAITFLTLGIGIIITWPIYLIVLVWTGFKLIRGLLKLNDEVPY